MCVYTFKFVCVGVRVGVKALVSTSNVLYSCMLMKIHMLCCSHADQYKIQPAQLSLSPAAICLCLTLPLSITALT